MSEQQNMGIPEGFKMEETTAEIQYLVQGHKYICIVFCMKIH
jgi:hypothetical protein